MALVVSKAFICHALSPFVPLDVKVTINQYTIILLIALIL